jgi:hypothetical protein
VTGFLSLKIVVKYDIETRLIIIREKKRGEERRGEESRAEQRRG